MIEISLVIDRQGENLRIKLEQKAKSDLPPGLSRDFENELAQIMMGKIAELQQAVMDLSGGEGTTYKHMFRKEDA